MNIPRSLPIIVTFLAAATALSAQQQRPTFRNGIETVSIYATVRASDGRLVPDLNKEDFEIKDNGAIREVTVFSREIVPITVAMMLDMSVSQEIGVEWLRQAGHSFVDALIRADRAKIGSFGIEIAISPRLTGDKNYLHRILTEEIWPGGLTPLWEALEVAMSSIAAEPGRRVILALTDGFDSTPRARATALADFGLPTGPPTAATMSQNSTQQASLDSAGRLGNVRARVGREGFMVYAVGRNLPFHAVNGRSAVMPPLSKEIAGLAYDSGGGYRVVSAEANPADVMAQVAEELHHQYLIGFTPASLDGKVHKLDIKVKRDGMSVQGRKSYLASNK